MRTFPPVLFPIVAAFALGACDARVGKNAAATPDTARAGPGAAPTAQTAQKPVPPPPSTTATLAPDTLSDAVITARIKAGILSDPGMTGSDVSVNTDGGVVSLAGSIKSHEQAAIASAHAQRPDGVLRVNNQLSVKPS